MESQKIMHLAEARTKKEIKGQKNIKGVLLTLIIALLAGQIAKLPFYQSWVL